MDKEVNLKCCAREIWCCSSSCESLCELQYSSNNFFSLSLNLRVFCYLRSFLFILIFQRKLKADCCVWMTFMPSRKCHDLIDLKVCSFTFACYTIMKHISRERFFGIVQHYWSLTVNKFQNENEPFSTTDRSERVEKFLFRATRESISRPEPRRCAAPGSCHVSAAWRAAEQQVCNLAPQRRVPIVGPSSNWMKLCAVQLPPPPPPPTFTDSRLLVELCVTYSPVVLFTYSCHTQFHHFTSCIPQQHLISIDLLHS